MTSVIHSLVIVLLFLAAWAAFALARQHNSAKLPSPPNGGKYTIQNREWFAAVKVHGVASGDVVLLPFDSVTFVTGKRGWEIKQ